MPACAASTSFTLTPSMLQVARGEKFTMALAVNPQGERNYTVRTTLSYPPDLLQVSSFYFAGSWMPLNEPSYDAIDNTRGVLIKTAGYPHGFSDPTLFGTATFDARKAGIATIRMASGTIALDVMNQNSIAAPLPSVALVITDLPQVSAAQEALAVKANPTTPISGSSLSPFVQRSSSTVSSSSVFSSASSSALFAHIGSAATLPVSSSWRIVLFFLFLFVLFSAFRSTRRSSSS